MKNYDFFSGLFLIILSTASCLIAYRLRLGNISNPGSGLVPFVVAALLGLMSLGLCFKGLFEVTKEDKENQVFKGIEWGRVLLVLFALIGYGFAFNFLGFHICTFLMMTLLMRAAGRQKWWLTITISLLTVFFAYLIFETWLDCPFPRDLLEFE